MKLKSGSELLIQPTGEMWKKIRVELNEDVSNNESDLKAIKEWMKKQPHLPDEWEDQPLMTFLRGCAFSLEKCKAKLDMYFTMRTACPEFFSNRDVTQPILNEVMKKVQGPPLPGITPEGRRVTIIRGVHPNVEPHQITDALKLALMVGDVRLREEKEGVAGDVYVLDAAVLGPSLMVKMSPSVLKKFMICIQEAYPVKLKEIHIVNTSAIVERFVNLIKPFLKEKIRNRIFIHKDTNGLLDHIPKEMLPKDYGGDNFTMDELTGLWIEKLTEYREWFIKQDSIKADESLRPGKPKNYDELFGIDGSFRQLSID